MRVRHMHQLLQHRHRRKHGRTEPAVEQRRVRRVVPPYDRRDIHGRNTNPVKGHPQSLFQNLPQLRQAIQHRPGRDLQHLLFGFFLFLLGCFIFFRLFLCRFLLWHHLHAYGPQPQHYSALLAEGKTHAHTAQLHNQKDCQQYSHYPQCRQAVSASSQMLLSGVHVLADGPVVFQPQLPIVLQPRHFRQILQSVQMECPEEFLGSAVQPGPSRHL